MPPNPPQQALLHTPAKGKVNILRPGYGPFIFLKACQANGHQSLG